MTLEIGIVGLPNVGKSTLFNALTRAGAAVAAYPFTTIEPNVGVVPLADTRLDAIARVIHPEQVVPTTVRFVDIAGLVQGAHRGDGLGNQFLGHIRGVDAIAMVVRCFQAGDVAHVTEVLDPVRDIEVIDTELLLADLAVLERRVEKVRAAAKGRPRDFAAEMAWLDGLAQHLAAGQAARAYAVPAADESWARDLPMLTGKPRMFVANVGEESCPDGGPLAAAVVDRAAAEGAPAVVLCGLVEMGLQDWPADEAATYLAELGLGEPGLQRVARTGYELLDLITFFTATGGKVLHAWTVRRGALAPEAAGRVHGDMERGFIRAEVVHWQDLVAAGGMVPARERGHVLVHGRDYEVRDGDVMHFRFHV